MHCILIAAHSKQNCNCAIKTRPIYCHVITGCTSSSPSATRSSSSTTLLVCQEKGKRSSSPGLQTTLVWPDNECTEMAIAVFVEFPTFSVSFHIHNQCIQPHPLGRHANSHESSVSHEFVLPLTVSLLRP